MQYIPNNSLSRLSSQIAAINSMVNQNRMRRLREAQTSYNAHRAAGDPRMWQDMQDMQNTGLFSRLFADDALLPYTEQGKAEKAKILEEGLNIINNGRPEIKERVVPPTFKESLVNLLQGNSLKENIEYDESVRKLTLAEKLQELKRVEQSLNDVNNRYGWGLQRLNPAEYGLAPPKKPKGRGGVKTTDYYYEDGSGEKQIYGIPSYIKNKKAFLQKELGKDVSNVRKAATVTGAGYEDERKKSKENKMIEELTSKKDAEALIEPYKHFYGDDEEEANIELFKRNSSWFYKDGELHKIGAYEKKVIANMEKRGAVWTGGDPTNSKNYRETRNIADTKPKKGRKAQW